jgi:hypothetical protein
LHREQTSLSTATYELQADDTAFGGFQIPVLTLKALDTVIVVIILAVVFHHT